MTLSKLFIWRWVSLLVAALICALACINSHRLSETDGGAVGADSDYSEVVAVAGERIAEGEALRPASAEAPWVGFGKEDNVFCGADTDGPHPRYTEQILDVLKEYGVKATFFAVGENVALYGKQIKRIAAEGHEIGNHTYTHASLKSISREALEKELTKTEEEIEKAVGYPPKVFRPPEGCCNKTVVECANQMGYTTVLWTVDPRDWASPPVETVVGNIMRNVKAGAVILCHDYNSAKNSPTPNALRAVIPRLIEQGYRFVTVSELFRVE